jgi:hypothetical protein
MDRRHFRRFLQGRRPDWLLAAAALGVALLPPAALVPWTGDVSRLVSVPLAPITHLGVFLRDRVRPPRTTFDPRSPEALALDREVARYRTLYEQARLELEQSERALASLRAVRAKVGDGGGELIDASVVATDASRLDGVLSLNAGTRHGVRPGASVLADGERFAGVIAREVGAFSSTLIPSIRLPSIGVRLYPPEGSDRNVASTTYPGAVLKPTGRGGWTAEVASAIPLREGMIARLADDRYGRLAMGLPIGIVRSVEAIDRAPHARRVEVAPVVDFETLSRVTIASDSVTPSEPISDLSPTASQRSDPR